MRTSNKQSKSTALPEVCPLHHCPYKPFFWLRYAQERETAAEQITENPSTGPAAAPAVSPEFPIIVYETLRAGFPDAFLAVSKALQEFYARRDNDAKNNQ